MASAKFDIPAGIVVHPVYGAGPAVSGLQVPAEAIRRGARLYGDEEFFPRSVLLADTRRQNFALYPKKYYVDVLNKCLSCGARFVFFACGHRLFVVPLLPGPGHCKSTTAQAALKLGGGGSEHRPASHELGGARSGVDGGVSPAQGVPEAAGLRCAAQEAAG